MEKEKLKSVIESILFVNGDPIKISRISKITSVAKEEVIICLQKLAEEYVNSKRGFRIFKKDEEIQLVSSPDNIEFVEQLVKNELQDSLSAAALEVVSIVAYRGPISKSEIEAIRGVNCSYTLRNLLMRGLIERENNPMDSRGFLYKISFDFLKKLGISEVEKLPKYAILSKDERIKARLIEDGNYSVE